VASSAFAVWVTGIPASGKSTLVRSLKAQLEERGVRAVVLESDVLRPILTPHPRYDEPERDEFYRQVSAIGTLLTEQGIPVIFDATANRRAYRAMARRQISKFLEVYVHCPVETCQARDPKGIYRQARGHANNVPGLEAVYEPPENPDLIVEGESEPPVDAAKRLIALITDRYSIGK
jgi:adenylylsulfate kinase